MPPEKLQLLAKLQGKLVFVWLQPWKTKFIGWNEEVHSPKKPFTEEFSHYPFAYPWLFSLLLPKPYAFMILVFSPSLFRFSCVYCELATFFHLNVYWSYLWKQTMKRRGGGGRLRKKEVQRRRVWGEIFNGSLRIDFRAQTFALP